MKKILFKTLDPRVDLEQLSVGLLIYRILISISLINTHGIKKLTDFESSAAHIPDPFGLGGEFSTYFAIFTNIICPIFIILGLFTRLAVLPIVIVTLSGLLFVHYADPWAVKDVPLMYSLAFLTVLYLGPGKYSLDFKLMPRK